MKNYRIIEIKIPKLTKNEDAIVGFIPEIIYKVTYRIEYNKKMFFGLFDNWIDLRFWDGYAYRIEFSSLMEAEKWIEFREEIQKSTIVKTY
jgi:hypothetical protein